MKTNYYIILISILVIACFYSFLFYSQEGLISNINDDFKDQEHIFTHIQQIMNVILIHGFHLGIQERNEIIKCLFLVFSR